MLLAWWFDAGAGSRMCKAGLDKVVDEPNSKNATTTQSDGSNAILELSDKTQVSVHMNRVRSWDSFRFFLPFAWESCGKLTMPSLVHHPAP
jgi:hypothetical protein